MNSMELSFLLEMTNISGVKLIKYKCNFLTFAILIK